MIITGHIAVLLGIIMEINLGVVPVRGTIKGVFKAEGTAITDIHLQVIEISSLDINPLLAAFPLPMKNIRGVHPNINNLTHTEGIIGHQGIIKIEILIMRVSKMFPNVNNLIHIEGIIGQHRIIRIEMLQTRIDVYETLCPQQMLVHKGGKMKNWGGEYKIALSKYI